MDYSITYLAPKHDAILNRDLTPSERLSRSREQIEFIRMYLDQIERTTNHIYEGIDEVNLEGFARAIDTMLKAAENAAWFGDSSFHGHVLYTYHYSNK